MKISCEVCGVTAELLPDRQPPGWTVVYHDDYLDEYYCNVHAQVTV